MLNHVSMPHAALWVVQQARRSQGRDSRRGFNAARGFVGGAATKNEKCIHVRESFNAARGFVGGAAWKERLKKKSPYSFQCRTRLCGWCSRSEPIGAPMPHAVSMPHAALWVVQLDTAVIVKPDQIRFNAARGFVGGAASSLSALVPLRGKRPFGKSPEI